MDVVFSVCIVRRGAVGARVCEVYRHADVYLCRVCILWQGTTTHTKHIYDIQQQNSNYTQIHCECFTRQFAKQTDTLTEKHTTYKDTTSHSLLLMSKRL